MKRIINGLEWDIIDPSDHLFSRTLTGTIVMMTTEDQKIAVRELHVYEDRRDDDEKVTLRCPTCDGAVIQGIRPSRDPDTPDAIHYYYCKQCGHVLK